MSSRLELSCSGAGDGKYGGLKQRELQCPPLKRVNWFGIFLVMVIVFLLSEKGGPVVNEALPVFDRMIHRKSYIEKYFMAIDELVKMAEIGEPLWAQSFEGGSGKATLSFEEYQRVFTRYGGSRPVSFAVETTRETGLVTINNTTLIETLMDAGLKSELEKVSPSLGRSAVYSKESRISDLPRYLTVQFVRFFWKRETK